MLTLRRYGTQSCLRKDRSGTRGQAPVGPGRQVALKWMFNGESGTLTRGTASIFYSPPFSYLRKSHLQLQGGKHRL